MIISFFSLELNSLELFVCRLDHQNMDNVSTPSKTPGNNILIDP